MGLTYSSTTNLTQSSAQGARNLDKSTDLLGTFELVSNICLIPADVKNLYSAA